MYLTLLIAIYRASLCSYCDPFLICREICNGAIPIGASWAFALHIMCVLQAQTYATISSIKSALRYPFCLNKRNMISSGSRWRWLARTSTWCLSTPYLFRVRKSSRVRGMCPYSIKLLRGSLAELSSLKQLCYPFPLSYSAVLVSVTNLDPVVRIFRTSSFVFVPSG